MAERDYEGLVVLGSPRSGTTLMRRLLNAHPTFACPPETSLLSAAARFLREETFRGGLAFGVVPGLEFSGFSEAQVLERLRGFAFGFLREIATRQGKSRWAEKTATDIFHLDAIDRLCGDQCRFLGVVRHPLDVICSTKELADQMGMYLPELHEYVVRFPSPHEAFAHAWNDANRRLLDFSRRRPDACRLIRYEDLTADPEAEMAKVCEFLGEPTDVPQLLQAAFAGDGGTGLGDWKTLRTRKVEATSVGRWKELSAWTLQRLVPVVDATMRELGYDPSEVMPGSSPATDQATRWLHPAEQVPVKGPTLDRRREQLARMVASLKMKTDAERAE